VDDPLGVDGVEDYPVNVGGTRITLVEPDKGFERAYDLWNGRNHFDPKTPVQHRRADIDDTDVDLR
jgi:hypothetical protein